MKTIFAGLLFSLFLISCCPCKRKDTHVEQPHPVSDSIALAPVDSLFADSVNDICMDLCVRDMSALYATYQIGKVRGDTWKLWQKLHRNCMRSELSRSPLYFGVSNPIGAGGIVIIDGSGINSSMEFPRGAFSSEEVEKIFNNGTSLSSCDMDKETGVNIEFMVNSQLIPGTLDAGLKSKITTAKKFNAKIEGWRMNLVNIDMLTYLVNRSSHEDAGAYREALHKPNRFLVSKEFVINGFSGTIETRTDIGAGLTADLQAGIVVNMGNTNANLEFSYVNKRTIKVTTIGEFIVFVEVYTIPRIS